MKLNEITRRWLKNFAGEKIFQRGEDYFQSGMVYQMEYHPDNFSIYAEVSGNYGNYEVKISEDTKDINAYCDCPYDGYPCKHIIAVLLNFIENKKIIFIKQKNKNFFLWEGLLKILIFLCGISATRCLNSYPKRLCKNA